MTQGAKTCRFCSMEIPVSAKVCPHCRKTVGFFLTRPAKGCLGFIVVVLATIVLVSFCSHSHSSGLVGGNSYRGELCHACGEGSMALSP
jgi:hypothetical protein